MDSLSPVSVYRLPSPGIQGQAVTYLLYSNCACSRRTFSLIFRTVTVDGRSTTLLDPRTDDIQWITDLRSLPDFELPNAMAYLMDHGWSTSQVNNWKSTDGYRLFQDNHISSVHLSQCIHHSFYYVKAKCTRETSQNEKYDLWLLVDTSGAAVSGSCKCTADDSACKHMAAMLFSLSSFTDRHRDRGTEVGTDVACTWDKPRRESCPMQCDDIDVRVKDKDTDLVEASMKFYDPLAISPTRQTLIEKRLKALSQHGSLAHQYLSDSDSDESDDTVDIPDIHDIVASSTEKDFTAKLKQVYTEDVAHNIEERTRMQAESNEWYKYRVGHITSSVIHSIKHLRSPSPSCYVVNNVVGADTFKGNEHTRYGRKMEDIARNLYVQTQKGHRKLRCGKSGLVLCPSMPHLAASPDGIVTCGCCEPRLLEIKCPSKLRNSDIQTVCQSNKQNIVYDHDGLHLVKDSPWDSQVQFAMGITKMRKCHLVVYTSVKPYIHVAEVVFSQDDWAQTVNVANAFYSKYVIPRLFSNCAT